MRRGLEKSREQRKGGGRKEERIEEMRRERMRGGKDSAMLEVRRRHERKEKGVVHVHSQLNKHFSSQNWTTVYS